MARRLMEALNFAALRHRAHRRKGREGTPYINHLIEVAHILTLHGIDDEDLLCASVLHDTIEDVGVSAEELRSRFGPRVTALVLAVTDDENLPLWDQKQRQIDEAGNLPKAAQNLRVADKISNLRGILMSPPPGWSHERKLAYYAWAREVVQACTSADPSLLRTFEDLHETGWATLQMHTVIRRNRPLPS